jgi:hypothetical protein
MISAVFTAEVTPVTVCDYASASASTVAESFSQTPGKKARVR